MEIFKKHHQWENVKKICATLQKNGFTAWLAGGCVRDGLLGIIPKDFDVATNASPAEIEKLFKKTVDVGKSFGVIRVIENGEDIEVASFRKDGAYVDGRHPVSVEPSTPQDDAQRRDFTINALFFDPATNRIHDFVHGQEDLKKQLIKTVGIARDRFTEDKLRILRAIRFVSQLDFQLEKATLDAVVQLAPQISQVSIERVTIELNKLLEGKRPDKGLDLLDATGLLKIILPEVKYDKKEANLFKSLAGETGQASLGWLELFSLVSPESTTKPPNMPSPKAKSVPEQICRRLKFSKEKMATLLTATNLIAQFQNFKSLTEAERKKESARKESTLALKYLDKHGRAPKDLKDFVEKNKILPAPFMKAADLIGLGIQPGKQMGTLLAEAFDMQLEGILKNRDEALAWIQTKKT